LRRVTDGTRDQRALVRLQRTEANFHWKFLATPVSLAMSSTFTASFGCRHFSWRCHSVCPTLVHLHACPCGLRCREPSRRGKVGTENAGIANSRLFPRG